MIQISIPYSCGLLFQMPFDGEAAEIGQCGCL
jgi:hypothetical protein